MRYEDSFDDDPNFSLPWFFLTRIDAEAVPKYQAAIEQYALIDPEHELEIDMHSVWAGVASPALLCYKRGDLSEFWRVVDQVKAAERVA